MTHDRFKECIEACQACASVCNHCAAACLQEKDVTPLARCIRLDIECAIICETAAKIMSLNGHLAEHLCSLCADICSRCAAECEKHAKMGMEHCRECAEACRNCAEICTQMTHA